MVERSDPMRNASLAVMLGALLVAHSAMGVMARGDSEVWFWENERGFGWSDIPDYQHGNRPPPPITSKMSVAERCGRLVGRQMVRDRSGRVYSTQLEDACIRNGGKI